MSLNKSCYNCRLTLTELARQYYCCEYHKIICERCRKYECSTCHKTNWKEIKMVQCKLCRKVQPSIYTLKQQICGSNYCVKCIANLYMPLYLSKLPATIIEIYCGHFMQVSVVQQFMQIFCIACGYQWEPLLDFQLKNGMKLCRICEKYQNNKFSDVINHCINCDNNIRSLKEAVEIQEILICRICAQEQGLMQNELESSRIAINKEKSTIIETKPTEQIQQSVQFPQKELSIVSRFSAFDIVDEEVKNNKSSLRLISKHSVQTKVQNFITPVIVPTEKTVRCRQCGVFTLNNQRICKQCYSQDMDKSQIPITRTFPSMQQQRQKYTSLQKPKTNTMTQLLQPKNDLRSNGQSQLSFIPASLIKSNKSKLQQWQISKQEDNKCQICRNKRFIITRASGQKVCTDCYRR